jgi:hypothetical protein
LTEFYPESWEVAQPVVGGEQEQELPKKKIVHNLLEPKIPLP